MSAHLQRRLDTRATAPATGFRGRELPSERNWRRSRLSATHRIGAIRKLRWSDIDRERGVIRWRAENEKSGYEHTTPVTPEAVAVLEVARRRNPGTGEAPVLPATKDPSACMSRSLARNLVEQSPEARGTDTQARPGLALPETKVCLRSHGPAAKGALRTRRLENRQDGASVLSATRRRTA